MIEQFRPQRIVACLGVPLLPEACDSVSPSMNVVCSTLGFYQVAQVLVCPNFKGIIRREVGTWKQKINQNKDVKMMRRSRIHVSVFFVFLSVCYPVNVISNIFDDFPPLFDLSLSNNDTTVNTAVNVTLPQGIWFFLWLPCFIYG